MNNFRHGVLEVLAENGLGISDLNDYIEKESGSFLNSVGGSSTAEGLSNLSKGIGNAVTGFFELPLIKPVGIPVGVGLLGAYLLANRKSQEDKKTANKLLQNYQQELLLDDIRYQRNRLERENESATST